MNGTMEIAAEGGSLTAEAIADEASGAARRAINAPDAPASPRPVIVIEHRPGWRAVDIKERSVSWREHGWEGYNPDADPYSSNQLDYYRRTRAATSDDSLADHELAAGEMSGQYVDYMKMTPTGQARDDLDTAHNFEPSESELRMNETERERQEQRR